MHGHGLREHEVKRNHMVQRHPGGQPVDQPKGHGNARTLHRRLQDRNIRAAMIADGENSMHGSVLGLMLMDASITETEYTAACRYADVAGKYDRYFGTGKRTIASFNYERGYGREDEVEKHGAEGTIGAYERRARKAKKQWTRVQAKIPTEHARTVIDEVCLFDREVNSALVPDFKLMMMAFAWMWGLSE